MNSHNITRVKIVFLKNTTWRIDISEKQESIQHAAIQMLTEVKKQGSKKSASFTILKY